MTVNPPETAHEGDRSRSLRFFDEVYRWRWVLTVVVLLGLGTTVVLGMRWVMRISGGVAQLSGAVSQDQGQAQSAPLQLFDPRVEIWFESDSDAVRAYRRINDELLTDDVVFVALEESDDPFGVFGAETLSTVDRLTRALTTIPDVADVRSLTNSLTVRWDGAEGTLRLERLLTEDPASYTDAERVELVIRALGVERARALLGDDAVERILEATPRLRGQHGSPDELDGLVSDDGRTTAVLVHVRRPRVPEHKLDAALRADDDARALGTAVHVGNAQLEVVQEIERVLPEVTDRSLHVAGLPIIQKRFNESGQADMVLVGVMFVVIALVLTATFRSVSGVLLPMAVVVGALAGMQGAVWLIGDLLNNLTAICPNVVTAVAIANSIHLVMSYHVLRRRIPDRRALVVEVVRKNALPVFLTALTTAIGFLSLLASDIVPMRMLGYTAAIGTAFGYLLSMTLIPAVLSLIPVVPGRGGGGASAGAESEPGGGGGASTGSVPGWSRRLIARVERYRRWIVVFTLVAIAGALLGMSRLELATDVRELLAEDDAVRQDMVWIQRHFGGTGDLELLFESSEPIGESSEFLHLLASFQQRLEQETHDGDSPLRVISHVYSPAPMMRDVVDALDAESPPPFSPQLARFVHVMSAFTTSDRRAFRVAARVENVPTPELLAAFDRIHELAHAEYPRLVGSAAAVGSGDALSSMTLTGKFYLFTTMMDRFSRALVLSLSIALGTITLLILLVFRSAALMVASLASNVLPIVLPLGIYGLAGVPLDGPAIIVAAVALGVCVDDTIHLLTAFSRARRAGIDTSTALRKAFGDVGRALTLTTVVLVLGFSVLMLSDFRPNAVVGRLGVVMLLLAWIADFLVIPAVISGLGGRSGRAP